MLPNHQNQINAHNFIQGNNNITNNPTININLPPIKLNHMNDKIASYTIVPSSDAEEEEKSKYSDSPRHILRETVQMSDNQ
eukprot:403360224